MIPITEEQYREYQVFHGLFPLDAGKRKIFDAAYPEYGTEQVMDCPKGRLLLVTLVRVSTTERPAHPFALFTTTRTRMLITYEEVQGLNEFLHQRWKEEQIPPETVIVERGTPLWRQIAARLKGKNRGGSEA